MKTSLKISAFVLLALPTLAIAESSNIAIVPEPGSLTLLGLGGMLFLFRRRKFQN